LTLDEKQTPEGDYKFRLWLTSHYGVDYKLFDSFDALISPTFVGIANKHFEMHAWRPIGFKDTKFKKLFERWANRLIKQLAQLRTKIYSLSFQIQRLE